MDLDSNMSSYPDIGERAFGTKGRALVAVAMNVELYLVATGFLILEGDNLHSLYPDFRYEIAGIFVGGRGGFILIIGLIVLPTVWLDNMSILSYISATGVVSSFILIASILWAAVFDEIGFSEKGTLLSCRGIPTAISLYAFCYCAHPVFPTLYTSMRDQKKFSKVMFGHKVDVFVGVLGFLIATAGYARLLSGEHHGVCIDGRAGVSHVRRWGSVSGDVESSDQQSQLESGYLHHIGEPIG